MIILNVRIKTYMEVTLDIPVYTMTFFDNEITDYLSRKSYLKLDKVSCFLVAFLLSLFTRTSQTVLLFTDTL